MAVSKAQQRATSNYVKKAYDRIELKVTKGKKEVLQVLAARHGLSLNAYINAAIAEKMERDSSATEALLGSLSKGRLFFTISFQKTKCRRLSNEGGLRRFLFIFSLHFATLLA